MEMTTIKNMTADFQGLNKDYDLESESNWPSLS